MKNLFTFLLMAILAIGYSHATTEIIDFSNQGYTNAQKVTTLKGENCTITFGDGSNPCAYYTTGNAVRIYGGGSVQITSSLAITKVVYTFAKGNAPTSSNCTITPSTGKATLGTTSLTWTGSTQSLEIKRKNGSGHWRLQKIEIIYDDDAVATPTFTPAGGQYTDVLDVTIACATTGAAIKYSTDGGTTWLDYTAPVAVTAGSTTLMAKAVRSDGKESATATAIYTIVPATPTFTPAGGLYTDAQQVTIACATTGAAIKYSTDGGTTWLDYTAPVAVTAASTTITAKAVRDGQESATATATYQVVPAAPTLSQGSSLFADPFTLTITRGAGATSMVYTVNGTSTTTTEATVSLPIAETTTVTAHGVNDAGTQSPEVSATYTYSTLAGNKYKLVTSASELVAGKHYVIVCRLSDPNYAMSGSGHDPTFAVGSNYYRSYSQGFSYADASTRDEIVVTDLSTVLTLAGSEGKWQWRVSNAIDKDKNPIEGYLQADATASSHYMYVYNTDNKSYNEANTLTTVTFPKDGITYNSTKTEPAGVQITFNVSPKDDKGRDKFIMMNTGNSHYFGPYGTQYPVCLYGEVSSEPATVTLKDLMTQGSGAFDVADASMQAITRVKDKVASRYYVLVKDADGASIEKVEKAEGLASYKVNGQDQTAYDQSNWMLVEVSEQDYTAFDKENCSVSRIAGGLYNGDACNPVLSRAADGTMPVITYGDKGDQYTPNQYCPVNFMASYTSDYSGNGAQGSNGTATYFFMNPKAQEYATVVWAVWDKATGAFYVPAPDGVNNKLGFYGKFEVALDYNDGDVKDLNAVQDQHMYTFPAIVKKLTAQQAAARKVNAHTGGGTAQPGYIVYPLELNAASSVVTAVSDVHSTKAVKRVSYYNLAGAEIAAPQAGVNIVVTTYTDGTTRATKLLK